MTDTVQSHTFVLLRVCVFVKQQIQELTNDNSTLKLKLRRVEEDYIKKVVCFSRCDFRDKQ